MRDPHAILIRPLLTEKTVAGARQNKYVFEVDTRATKVEIRRAVEALFPEVLVAKVNTLAVVGKRRRMMGYGRRRRGPAEGFTARHKKAVVTLKQGRIAVFEAV